MSPIDNILQRTVTPIIGPDEGLPLSPNGIAYEHGQPNCIDRSLRPSSSPSVRGCRYSSTNRSGRPQSAMEMVCEFNNLKWS